MPRRCVKAASFHVCRICVGTKKKGEQKKHGEGLEEWKDDEFHLNKFDIFVEKPQSKGAKTSPLKEQKSLICSSVSRDKRLCENHSARLTWSDETVLSMQCAPWAFSPFLSLFFFSVSMQLHNVTVAIPSSLQHMGSIRFQKNAMESYREQRTSLAMVNSVSVEIPHSRPSFYIHSRQQRLSAVKRQTDRSTHAL